jgi:hypothetical protein
MQTPYGVDFRDLGRIRQGMDVVVLHRDYYMGEREYRMTRGSFQGWGRELQDPISIQSRIDHLENRHNTEHPYSMYRGYEFDKLAQTGRHFHSVQLNGDRVINMDNVVGIIPGDQVPADIMAASSAASTPGSGTGTVGSATRRPTGTGSTGGGSIGRRTTSSGGSGNYDCPTTGTRRTRTGTTSRGSSGSSRGVSSRGSSRGTSIGARIGGTRTRSAGSSVTRTGGKKTGGGIYKGASKKGGDGN